MSSSRAKTITKTSHVEGCHSAAWINEPQRRPHWDFRSLGRDSVDYVDFLQTMLQEEP